MAFGFGFSIGDIIAISKLVGEIYQSFQNASGLKQEAERILSLYMSLLQAIQLLQTALDTADDRAATAVLNAVQHHTRSCKAHLEVFLEHSGSVMFGGTTVRRVRYALERKALLRELNESFDQDLKAIQTLASAIQSERQKDMRSALGRTEEVAQLINCNLQTFVGMLGSMPRDLGYTWEGGELKAQVSVLQASGEQQFAPMELCRDSETFIHGFLLAQKAYPGRRRVELGHLRLMDLSTGRRIELSPDSWKQDIYPGMKMAISVVVGTLFPWGDSCPRCGSVQIQQDTFVSWKKCGKCLLLFEQMAAQDLLPTNHEPLDTVCRQWGLEGAGERNVEAHPAHPAAAGHMSQPVPPTAQAIPPGTPDEDREACFKRVTMVHNPVFNQVYRASLCLCRLGGDTSPWGVDIDIPIFSVCRIHNQIPDELQQDGVEINVPPPGYDPEQDPYFDQFGGHLAFAAFFCTNSIIEHSLCVQKLLPSSRIGEGIEAMNRAAQNPDHSRALKEAAALLHKNYFLWRSQYGEKHAKAMEELSAKRRPKTAKRRGSFC